MGLSTTSKNIIKLSILALTLPMMNSGISELRGSKGQGHTKIKLPKPFVNVYNTNNHKVCFGLPISTHKVIVPLECFRTFKLEAVAYPVDLNLRHMDLPAGHPSLSYHHSGLPRAPISRIVVVGNAAILYLNRVPRKLEHYPTPLPRPAINPLY